MAFNVSERGARCSAERKSLCTFGMSKRRIPDLGEQVTEASVRDGAISVDGGGKDRPPGAMYFSSEETTRCCAKRLVFKRGREGRRTRVLSRLERDWQGKRVLRQRGG